MVKLDKNVRRSVSHDDENIGGKLRIFAGKMCSRSVLEPTFTLVTLFFFQNWTGFIATIFFGVNIFKVKLLMNL